MASKTEPAVQPSLSMRTVMYGIRKQFPGVQHITSDQLAQMKQNEDVTLLDSRESKEYSVSRIPGAIRADHESNEPWSELDLSITKNVVCYCSVGYRSSILADKLKKHFHKEGKSVQVYNLEGGLFQWAIEGREMDGDKVHPYNSFWGRLLPSALRHSNL